MRSLVDDIQIKKGIIYNTTRSKPKPGFPVSAETKTNAENQFWLTVITETKPENGFDLQP